MMLTPESKRCNPKALQKWLYSSVLWQWDDNDWCRLDGERTEDVKKAWCVLAVSGVPMRRLAQGSGFGRAYGSVAVRVVVFRAQRVCGEDPFELLQGAVDCTTTPNELILQKEKVTWGYRKKKKMQFFFCFCSSCDTFSAPTSPTYDTLTKASLVFRFWCSSTVRSAAYGGHLMSKIPKAKRQGIRVVSCAEYKNTFLFERAFQEWSIWRPTTVMCEIMRVQPAWLWWGAL